MVQMMIRFLSLMASARLREFFIFLGRANEEAPVLLIRANEEAPVIFRYVNKLASILIDSIDALVERCDR